MRNAFVHAALHCVSPRGWAWIGLIAACFAIWVGVFTLANSVGRSILEALR